MMLHQNRFSGWPSRGKRFGEGQNPGPTVYYPPAQQPSARAFAFRGQEMDTALSNMGTICISRKGFIGSSAPTPEHLPIWMWG
eukprot:57914-Heterocapsa_arctica.AAC.1